MALGSECAQQRCRLPCVAASEASARYHHQCTADGGWCRSPALEAGCCCSGYQGVPGAAAAPCGSSGSGKGLAVPRHCRRQLQLGQLPHVCDANMHGIVAAIHGGIQPQVVQLSGLRGLQSRGLTVESVSRWPRNHRKPLAPGPPKGE